MLITYKSGSEIQVDLNLFLIWGCKLYSKLGSSFQILIFLSCFIIYTMINIMVRATKGENQIIYLSLVKDTFLGSHTCSFSLK